MLKLSEKKLAPVPIGTSVRIAVPEVDRGRDDARNIIGVVLNKTDDKLYQIVPRKLPTFNPMEPAKDLRSALARKTVLKQDVCVLKIKYYVLSNAIRAKPENINSYMD
ncbi:hypothetical protein KGM_210698 [Danaus plexippus plexippus]|uniref:Uncharacterized protein n=1 Tax=Danaus plexippus plexippus TaxID=278856 RepID=A0A212F8I7_DANPL|nr:hypothetical protein KGM_210698 [Danaus plexippus plexippus]